MPNLPCFAEQSHSPAECRTDYVRRPAKMQPLSKVWNKPSNGRNLYHTCLTVHVVGFSMVGTIFRQFSNAWKGLHFTDFLLGRRLRTNENEDVGRKYFYARFSQKIPLFTANYACSDRWHASCYLFNDNY